MEPSSLHAGFDVVAVSKKLSEPVDYSDVKFRPVGGGKQAAYVAADKIVHSESWTPGAAGSRKDTLEDGGLTCQTPPTLTHAQSPMTSSALIAGTVK